ncbi:MAG: EpsG family protein [Muribaculum sp.]|nr:EpsG family protein [Muribaculum sp.]
MPVAVLLCINPLLGFALALLGAVTAPGEWKQNRVQLITFVVTAAVWISLVNITKQISSDQINYTNIFLNVPEKGLYGTLFETWENSSKEPVYSFITWVLYWLTGGSVRLFYFLLSFSIYSILFAAVYRIYRSTLQAKGAFICGILVIVFFTQYFVITVHLIRQVLAASVVMYAISYRATTGRNTWVILAVAVLIHTSALLLAGLSIVPWFYRRLSLFRASISVACFIPIIVFNSILVEKLGGSGIEALNYSLERLSQEDNTDNEHISISLMLMIFVPLSIVGIKLLWEAYMSRKEDYDKGSTQTPLLPIVYLFFLLMLFVLSFSKSNLIQYRFFYYSYTFVPILVPLLISRGYWAKPYWVMVSVFFIVRFFLIHNTSGMQYCDVQDLLWQPIIFYFTGVFDPLYLI